MSKPAKVYKMREEGKAKTLGNLIALLPSSDVDYSDLKTLVLQLITDTPSDSKETHYSSRARIKLDALRLLADIVRNDEKGSFEEDLLATLIEEEEEDVSE
mgnify:CR=1 FL=1